MIHDIFPAFVVSGTVERLTLMVNHVLASEDIAVRRLRPHAGRCVELALEAWPAWLPAPPALVFRLTPAGLLEWCGLQPTETVDLKLRLDASSPLGLLARGLAGERPAVEVQGDAGLATDLSWLMDNLRWDAEDDLARIVGPGPAHAIAGAASALASGLRAALRGLQGSMGRTAGRGAQ